MKVLSTELPFFPKHPVLPHHPSRTGSLLGEMQTPQGWGTHWLTPMSPGLLLCPVALVLLSPPLPPPGILALTGIPGEPVPDADRKGFASGFEDGHVALSSDEGDIAGAATAPALLLHPKL